MYKKAWSTHRVVVLPIWTYWFFFPFSLTSSSSLLKLPNVWGGRCKTKQEGILYAHASIWSVEVPQSCHRGIFCESFTFTTSICSLFSGAAWRMLGATSDKRVLYGIEEFLRWKWVHCSLAFALERTVFPFVKRYIKDKMAAECCYNPTSRAHVLSSRKSWVW